jgi:hypothetical protein
VFSYCDKARITGRKNGKLGIATLLQFQEVYRTMKKHTGNIYLKYDGQMDLNTHIMGIRSIPITM